MRIKWKELANRLIDNLVDQVSAVGVVELLIFWGYSKEQILSLGFNEHTIDQVNSNMEKGE